MELLFTELPFLQFTLFSICVLYLLLAFNSNYGTKTSGGNNHIAPLFSVELIKHFIKSKLDKLTPLESLRKLRKDKSILTASIPVNFILVRDYEIVKEISLSENFADRPIGAVFSGRHQTRQDKSETTRGMLQNNGPSWKEVRSFTMKKLGQLGFGKRGRMASFIEGELQDILEYIAELSTSTNNQIPVHDLFANSVINVVWSIAAGEKFTRDNPEYIAVKNNNIEATSLPHGKILSYQCKPLRRIIQLSPQLFGFKDIFDALDNLGNYFTNFSIARQQLGNYKSYPEDFIDGFLQEIDKHNESDDEKMKNIYCIDELAAVLMDLFQAGIDTTNNTLEGAMMLMIKNPSAQKKIQEEIDLVVGCSRFPSYYEDKQKMPYTTAAILEINRMVSIVPVSARTAKSDCEVAGLKIKKGTYAFLQLHAIRMDEKYWGDPEQFRPERFLDCDNNIISSKVNRLFAFGGGMRVCPGEAVATATIFAFLTGILQRYTLTRTHKNEVLKMIGSNSITNSVVPFHMSVIPRN